MMLIEIYKQQLNELNLQKECCYRRKAVTYLCFEKFQETLKMYYIVTEF